MTRLSAGVLVFWILVAAFADHIASSPDAVDKTTAPYSAPSAAHVLGTDAARRDAFARLVHGTRATLEVGALATAIMLCVGVAMGLAAGYAPPLLDALLLRITDAVLALPVLFIVLAVAGVTPHAGGQLVAMAIGLTSWPPLARLLRVETQRLRNAEFVLAARMMGGGPLYVLRRHVVPHVTHLIVVAGIFGFASAAMVEAALAFLGVGAPDSTASWGALMRHGEQHITAWWLVVAPALALLTLTLALGTLGERLRNWRGGPTPDSVSIHG